MPRRRTFSLARSGSRRGGGPRWRLPLRVFQGVLVAVLVAGSALAFGGAEQWASGLLVAGGVLLAFFWGAETLLARPGPEQLARRNERRLLAVLALPAAALALVAGLQLLPISAGMMRMASPATHARYATALPGYPGAASWREYVLAKPAGGEMTIAELFAEASPAPGASRRRVPAWVADTGSSRPLALDPAAAVRGLFRWVAYAAIFLTCLRLGVSTKFRRRALVALGVWGFVLAIAAILQEVASPSRIYGLREVTSGGAFYGPFANRNHFAAYLAMLLPLLLFPMLHEVRRVGEAWRARRDELRERGPRLFLWIFLLAVVAAALTRSLSRGGMLSLAVSLLFFLALRSRWRVRPLRAAAALVVLMVALGFGYGFVRDRLPNVASRFVDAERDAESRVRIWRDTIACALDAPVLGWGVGSYPLAVAPYKRPTEAGRLLQAHNDYLELWAETGTAGMVAIAALAGAFVWVVWRRGRSLHGRERAWLLALGAGLTAAALHEVTDFGLQMPANAALFAALAGLAAALVLDSEGPAESDSLAPPEIPPLRLAARAGRLAGVAALAALCALGVWQALRGAAADAERWGADRLLRRMRDDASGPGSVDSAPEIAALARRRVARSVTLARGVAPDLVSELSVTIARRGWGSAELDPGLLLLEVLHDRPADGRAWLRYAKLAWNEGRADLARPALGRALKLDPTAPDGHRFAALFHLENGEPARYREHLETAYAIQPFAEIDRYPMTAAERIGVKIAALERHMRFYPEYTVSVAERLAALDDEAGQPGRGEERLRATLRGAASLPLMAAPDAPARLHLVLGRRARAAGNAAGARTELTAAYAAGTDDTRYEAALELAQLAGGQGSAGEGAANARERTANAVEMERWLAAARELRPGGAETWIVAGDAAAARKDWPAARKAYETALGIDPRRGDTASRLAATLVQLGHRGAALDAYRRSLAANPSDLGAHQAAVGLALSSGDYPGAAELLSEALRRFPADDTLRASALVLARANLEREERLRRMLAAPPESTADSVPGSIQGDTR